ncbi:MAG: hypothetical protein V3U74_06545 [Thermodesulfobacteriota bacterium]
MWAAFKEAELLSPNKTTQPYTHPEIAAGEYFHNFYSKPDDDSIDMRFETARNDRLPSFIAERGRFDWHKNAVVQVLKSPNLRKVLMKKLLIKAVGMG